MVLIDRLDCYLSTKNRTTLYSENQRTRSVDFSAEISLLYFENVFFFLVDVGDASNFDDYEEEPRKIIFDYERVRTFDLTFSSNCNDRKIRQRIRRILSETYSFNHEKHLNKKYLNLYIRTVFYSLILSFDDYLVYFLFIISNKQIFSFKLTIRFLFLFVQQYSFSCIGLCRKVFFVFFSLFSLLFKLHRHHRSVFCASFPTN